MMTNISQPLYLQFSRSACKCGVGMRFLLGCLSGIVFVKRTASIRVPVRLQRDVADRMVVLILALTL
jgi:hypothetical protein